MSKLTSFITLALLLGLVHLNAKPVMLPATTSAGQVSLSPATGISGEFGTWTVRYIIGPDGIAQGGGIRVELPDSWHAGPRNSANRLQSVDPADQHYVTAQCSRSDVTLETEIEGVPPEGERLVKGARQSLDGRYERYVIVVHARLTEGALKEGDVISIIYGERSGGSPGFRAAPISTGPEPVLIAVDESGDDRFQLHTSTPLIQALPGDAVEMLFHAPSQAQVGSPVTCRIALLDKQRNPASRSADIDLKIVTGEATLPDQVRIPPNQGYAEFTITPTAPGIVRIKATSIQLEFSATSNPTEASREMPERQLYWGDLHSHGEYSSDGVGRNSFAYARNISGLDFYALTDHSRIPAEEGTLGLSRETWAEYSALTDQYNDPPRFVAIHAYECSFKAPYGHHNVYFRGRPGALAFPEDSTLPELWAMLEAGNALTIPHHTGGFPQGIDLFSWDNPELRRNFEIYSGHGLSEAYNPEHPLSFENTLFTKPNKSATTPTNAQDVWAHGMQLSVIASSDDHRAHPGQPQFGLAAIRAESLTRNDIFQALYDRHTYGTTGARIILSVTVDDTPMGQIAEVADNPQIEVRVAGTDTLDCVELLKYQAPAEKFEVIKTWYPRSLDFESAFTDEAFEPGAIYYLRLTQQKFFRGRPVMAWSSPIWTKGR